MSDVSVVEILLLIETCFAGRVGREGVLLGSGLGVCSVTLSFCLPCFQGLLSALAIISIPETWGLLTVSSEVSPLPRSSIFKKKPA